MDDKRMKALLKLVPRWREPDPHGGTVDMLIWNNWLWLVIVSFLLLCSILLFSLTPVWSHDHARPELADWYKGLRSDHGGPCCDGSEAIHLADLDWESKAGHYRVRIDGVWIDVPDKAVINGPNRDGRTLVWPYKAIDSETMIRCFMPGAMT